MHYELWAISTGNCLALSATEDDALKIVRDLLAVGWKAEELSLGLENEDVYSPDLPPVISGEELKALAYAYELE